MIVAAVIWITAPITALAVMWAIYSNNQMEVMQEKLWRLQDENSKLKEQINNKKTETEIYTIQVKQEIAEKERLRDERSLFKTVG